MNQRTPVLSLLVELRVIERVVNGVIGFSKITLDLLQSIINADIVTVEWSMVTYGRLYYIQSILISTLHDFVNQKRKRRKTDRPSVKIWTIMTQITLYNWYGLIGRRVWL